jgi:pyridoxal phosphate enzyme (YggS family)
LQEIIEGNLEIVRARIAAACSRVGRRPDDVTIIAVTKTHGPEVVDAAIAAGLAHVGENRVQEYVDKHPRVQGSCRWHLIGTLQRNKATKAIGQFEMIHSVDRVKLADTLQRLGGEHDMTTRVLLEVNTTSEATKHGFDPEEVVAAARAVAGMDRLQLEGLMTLGPLTDDVTRIRRAFQSLFRLREKVELDLGRPLPHLSMGMSGDYEIAVEEGATMIRLGRVLFGERGA